MRQLIVLLAFFVIAGCAGTPQSAQTHCASAQVSIDTLFEGGRFASCVVGPGNSFTITIAPEDAPPINVSPWYAMRISGKRSDQISITLEFTDGYARYWPKLSADKINWSAADEVTVTRSPDGKKMHLALTLTNHSMWLAAQEIIDTQWYELWLAEISQDDQVNATSIGQSTLGRPLYAAQTTGGNELVVLLGRAHPPEVSGALAMRSFVGRVLDDTPLAREFRQRFSLLIMPLLNPDGVALGHWRHNVNGVDPNRDWGPFTQKENRAFLAAIEAAAGVGREPVLMLDFHSTKENLFYTQLAAQDDADKDFASIWLTRAAERLDAYDFKHDAREVSEQANSKNYFHKRYAIPAITYEVGDETDRAQVHHSALVFAEEMMRTLLEQTAAE